MIADSVVPFVALLEVTAHINIHPTHREANLPNGVTPEPHEYVPFLLVSDGAVSLSDFVRIYQFLEAGQGFIIRVNRFGEG